MKHTIRIILSIVLLIVVWTHAHWSVALAITLLAGASEAQDYLYRQLERRNRDDDEASQS